MSYTYWNIDLISDYLKTKGNTKILSTKYTKACDKYDFLCECNTPFTRSWTRMLHDDRFTCVNCSYKESDRKGKYLPDEVRNICKENGFIVINMDDYKNINSKIQVKDKFGYKYIVPFVSILKKIKINKFHRSNIYTMENIRTYMKINNIDYILFDDIDYKTSSTKLHFQCNNGHNFYMSLNKLTQGKRCPHCHIKSITKTNDDFIDELFEKYGEEYTPLEDYINNSTKISIRHNVCGNVFKSRPFSILGRGDGCPYCNVSRGERKCKEWLIENNFIFEQEYKFDDLVGKQNVRLRYDFAVFDKMNKIICLIEYDGEFHYKNIFDDDKLKQRQEYDKRKDQYASEHDIELIRIPYWEFDNIEKILESRLLKQPA